MSDVSHNLSRTRRRQGFSLVEMMVVMGIIIALAGLTMGVKQYLDSEAAENTAVMELKALATAIEEHKRLYGDYPYTGQDANGESSTLYAVLSGEKRWVPVPGDQPRLETIANPEDQKALIDVTQMTVINNRFTDPWGAPYQYSYRGAPNPSNPGGGSQPTIFTLSSNGPDGQPGQPNASNQSARQQAADNVYAR